MISLMNLTVDMIIEGLSYVEVMIQNLNVACAVICMGIMLLIVFLSESFWFRVIIHVSRMTKQS